MKKLSLLLILLPAFSWAAPVQPEGFFIKPYIGANYDYVSVDYKDSLDTILEDNLNGGDVHIGARVHKYLGVEASYLLTSKETKDNVLGTGVSTGVKLEGPTFDLYGYLPLGDGKFELIGTAGVSILKAKLDLNGAGGNASQSKTETKGRIGGGAQFWVNDHINIRGLVRYQDADFGGTVNSATVTSLGVNWQF